jgi:D-3-phosphoglycerate dehydrogenase
MQNCFEEVRGDLEQAGIVADLPRIPGQQFAAVDLIAILDGYDGVIAGDDFFTREVFERAPRLRVISKWGVGTDSIDKVAAAQFGVAVTNTPGMFDDEVADVTVAYLVMLARGLHQIDRDVRAGGWNKPEGRSLSAMTLGIVGLGGIGRGTARRAVAMGMSVVGCDPTRESRELAAAIGVEAVSFDELVARSGAIALNCPLTPQTAGLINADVLSAARDRLLLVNTSRGPVVNESSLVEAVRAGKVAGAALDVFEEEPLPAGSALRSLPEVILGSHNASNTREAVLRTSQRAVQNLIERLETQA